LFRHGDRTLDRSNHESYPNDPYKDKDFYPYGDGQLTNVRSDLHVKIYILNSFVIIRLYIRLSLMTLIFKYYFCKYMMHCDFYR